MINTPFLYWTSGKCLYCTSQTRWGYTIACVAPHGNTIRHLLPLRIDGRAEVWPSDKYSIYQDGSISVLAELLLMRVGHFGRISVGKQRIKFVGKKTQPGDTTPNGARSENRGCEEIWTGKMLSQKISEPAQTELAAPFPFAPIKNKILRFCLYKCWLNFVAKRDSYPTSRMNECNASLGKVAIFYASEDNSRCWQKATDETGGAETGFKPHFGLRRFIRMPYGLRNTPGTFQRSMDVILVAVQFQFGLMYIDDNAIFFKSSQVQISHVWTGLNHLRNVGVTLKWWKSRSFTEISSYFWHIIRPRLEIAWRATDAIGRLEEPTTIINLELFFKLHNVFRTFVINFAHIAIFLKASGRKD